MLADILQYCLDFSNVLNASISASWMILAVLLLRFLLRGAPKWSRVALWGLVALRLLLPFSIESAFSLIPSAETVSTELLQTQGAQLQQSASIELVTNPIFNSSVSVELNRSVGSVQINIMTLTFPWLAGMALMLIYTAVSYFHLRWKISSAVRLSGNIFQSENVASPFVLGIIMPRIYLPFHIDEQTLRHVVTHEQAHILRRDHWWKPLGFLLLTIHWFNPVMWLAYVLLCRDIELACDEKAVRALGAEQIADYSQALLACSVRRGMIAACPLAFGEVGVRNRVKSVLSYKKPAFWVIVISLIVCAAVALCFLTDPAPRRESLTWAQELSIDEVSKAELIVFPQTEDKQFKRLSGDELSSMVALINQSNGRYLKEHEELTGGSIFFYITMKDGTTHSAGNIGNTYLVIDGDYYEAKYEWLSTWSDTFGEGNEPLPEHYFSSTDNIGTLVAGKIYVYEGEGFGGDFSITLNEDGSFSYYEGLLSSYIGLGTWSVKGDVITLTDETYSFVNHFRMDGNDLVFISENSSNFMYQQIEDGARFLLSTTGASSAQWSEWELDVSYTEAANGGISLRDVFGTALGDYGAGLRLSGDGSIEYHIGVLSASGTWHEDGDTGRYTAELTVYPDERQETLSFHEFREIPEDEPWLLLYYEDYVLYWKQTEAYGAAALTTRQTVEFPLEFFFASGAGSWGTALTLYQDGSFTGVYHNTEDSLNAPEYPNGTRYESRFSGRFSEMTQINEYAFSMRLESLTTEAEVGEEWIEERLLYIASEPHGIDGGEEFILYLPGTPLKVLNEDFIGWWPNAYLWWEGSIDTLSSYGLHNVNTGAGFFSSD